MKKKSIAIIVLLIIQLLAIGFLIFRYERVVLWGTEVRFKCQAYDPYDPFRGRYLSATVSALADKIPESVVKYDYALRNKFVIRIEPAENGLWHVAEAAFEPTSNGIWVKPQSTTLVQRVQWNDKMEGESEKEFSERRKNSGYTVQANFPNQFFVNEKLAPKAEEILRYKSPEAVAVYRVLNGKMVFTDIEINGQSITKLAK